LTFCREVKNSLGTPDIPILLVVGVVRSEDLGLATDSGVLLVSMFQRDITKLVAAIEGVLAAHRPEPLPASSEHRTGLFRSA
jgi:hypothetical protein